MKNVHFPDTDYLRRLAAEAGEIMMRDFQLGMKISTKKDGTPITVTDELINQHVIDSIDRDYPHISVIGEEGNRGIGSEYVVIVDPVDGTKLFSHGIPIFTFVISVLKDGVPIATVVYDPFLGRMWHAMRGEKSFLNGKRTQVSDRRTLIDAEISIIPWKGAPINLLGACQKLMDAGAFWVNLFSIAYGGGMIASGEWDGSIFATFDGWETAGMQLLVEEAGGKATDLFGNPLCYGAKGEIKGGHIITNGWLHDDLVRLVEGGLPR